MSEPGGPGEVPTGASGVRLVLGPGGDADGSADGGPVVVIRRMSIYVTAMLSGAVGERASCLVSSLDVEAPAGGGAAVNGSGRRSALGLGELLDAVSALLARANRRS